jgi:hypothetical protein
VGAELCLCAAAIAGIVPGLGVFTGHGIALLPDVTDGERRDGRPQRVVQRKHPVIPMPVFSRLRDEIGEPVELTFRRQGHPWPLPPWAVAAKAKVWLDRRTGILPANGESSTKPFAPGRGDGGVACCAPSRFSISSIKILVTAATALGRSPRNPRNRFGSEITQCRTDTGGMT